MPGTPADGCPGPLPWAEEWSNDDGGVEMLSMAGLSSSQVVLGAIGIQV